MLSIKMLSTTSVQAASSHRQPWVFPSLPEFPEELVSSITVLPLHAGPPTVAVIPGVILTAQGALVPPACSPGCHTFVSVHFRWVPLRKVLLFLRSHLFQSPSILSQSMSTSCLAAVGCVCPLHCSSWLLWYGYCAYPAYKVFMTLISWL